MLIIILSKVISACLGLFFSALLLLSVNHDQCMPMAGWWRGKGLRLDDKKHPLSLNVTVLTLNFDRCMQAAQ